MADKGDSLPFGVPKENIETTSDNHESGSDKKHGSGAECQTENEHNAKDSDVEDSHGKTDMRVETEEKQTSDLFPSYFYSVPIRGKVILVVNKEFQQKSSERKGAERDLEYLKSVFVQRLGFEQLYKDQSLNLTKKVMEKVLAEATSRDYKDTDFFVFAISTHGEERPKQTEQNEHALMCSDEQYVYTTDIIDSFSRIPSLDGKPKIFLIQACRFPNVTDEKDHKIYDPGHEFQILTTRVEGLSLTKENDKEDAAQDKADAGHRSENDQTSQPGSEDEGQSSIQFLSNIRCPKDCLVVYATQSGKLAWRSETTGSWLFYQLHKVIEYELSQMKKQNPLMSFFDVLTKTAYGMAQRESDTRIKHSHGKKAVPIIRHRLTKDLIIPL